LQPATRSRWLTQGGPHGITGLGLHPVAAPCTSREKGVATLFFLNKEPSKPDMSKNKRGYLHGSPTAASAAFTDAAYYGDLCCVRACVACVLMRLPALTRPICRCVPACVVPARACAAVQLHACACLCFLNCHVLPACSPCLALLVLGCQELFFALLCLLMLGRP
jgi:hypothetical protein